MSFNISVIGGNGFVGSAVCRAAVRRGWKVQSISKSGKPFTTPNGHLPAWTSKVEWHAGDALVPESYRSLLSSTNAVVHTLGTLFDGAAYKTSLKAGASAAAAAGVKGIYDGINGGNPLAKGSPGSYESLNRDTAISVCQTFLSESSPSASLDSSPTKTFVYVSAEDVFRPVIPARYITTKREAESAIQKLCDNASPKSRSVFIRPSFIYHPHFRPISSPVATALSAAGSVHKLLGQLSPINVLSKLAESSEQSSRVDDNPAAIDTPLDSISRAMTIPPIHVDHVGEAVCESIERGDVAGPVGVWEMRRLLGWVEDDGSNTYAKV
ncbi:hypothetical protein M408DRAFT_329291 [Serendipita vermifera MAFF 305830]|uniref:NAD-dependent epimerase/dehydratase domain-containing protein n=1 Tax=Serendipita vermifera MAFF 305830 TaxID=933852 RepID=A0A0C2XIF3_SERVB|nr:hypothetical protein M408DRAFT_329291 [Serendipita vermifera MAFF 305830]